MQPLFTSPGRSPLNRYQPIEPAQLHWQDGVLYSPRFEDVFHSQAGAIEQALAIFMAGNSLPARFPTQGEFTVIETGFGQGLNCLVTLSEWAAHHAQHPRAHLHFVSFEKHPFRRQDLAQALAQFPPIAQWADGLLTQYPACTPGFHTVSWPALNARLTLWWGEAQEGLEQWQGLADAIYLDGFAPSRNESMWNEKLFHTLARKAASGCTVSTYTCAGFVRRGLSYAGFQMHKRPGFAFKRESLAGVYAPPPRTSTSSARSTSPKRLRKVAVIGAGMAGAWTAHALAWASARAAEPLTECVLYDVHGALCQQASGNPAGAFHAHVSKDDARVSQLSRMGVARTRASLLRLQAEGGLLEGRDFDLRGHLQLFSDEKEALAAQAAVETLRFPEEALAWLDGRALAEKCPQALAPNVLGALWFAHGGWIRPGRWCEAALAQIRAASELSVRLQTQTVHDLGEIDADAIVLAAGTGSVGVWCPPDTVQHSVKGQLTFLSASASDPWSKAPVLSGSAYAIALPGGPWVVGATYERPADNVDVTQQAHEENLNKLRACVPDALHDRVVVGGRSALRTVWPDRLPAVGWAGTHEGRSVYMNTAYASRGLTWAVLAGEHLASMLLGQSSPLPKSLSDAVDPLRQAHRAQHKRRAGVPPV